MGGQSPGSPPSPPKVGDPSPAHGNRFDRHGERRLREFAARIQSVALYGMPLMALLFAAVAVLDPQPWRLWALGGVFAALTLIFFAEQHLAVRQVLTPDTMRLYLPAALVAQGAVMVVTGGVHSPFVGAYIVVGAVAGFYWRNLPDAAPALAVAAAVLAAMAVAQGAGWLPPTAGLTPSSPSWLGLALMASVQLALMLMAAVFGRTLARLYEELSGELEDAQREVIASHRERLQSLEGLSGRMAHEIKNPLSAIKGLTQLLRRKGDETGHLEVVSAEIERLEEILDGFLGFARPLELLRQDPVDLSDLVRSVLSLSTVPLGDAGVEVVMGIGLGAGVVVPGDERRLKQVLLNLVLTALEAMAQADDSRRELHVDIARGGDQIALTLRDTGPGLQGAADDLFAPFVTHKPHGTGLGLPISRTIVRAHGGELTLRALERGVEARMTLPLLGVPAEPPA